MRAVGQADGGRGAADLLHRHDMLQVAHAGAPILRRDGEAEQADGAQFRPEIGGEVVGEVDGGGTRRDLIGGKGFHDVAQQVGDLAQVEVQAAHLVGHAVDVLRVAFRRQYATERGGCPPDQYRRMRSATKSRA